MSSAIDYTASGHRPPRKEEEVKRGQLINQAHGMNTDDDEYGNVLQFVIQDVETQRDATEYIKTVYSQLEKFGRLGKWISHSECLRIETPKICIFIMDPLSGPVFDHLVLQKCRIVGPMFALRYLGESPWPRYPYPVYSAIMKDITITCTNLSKPVRDEIFKRVKLMGGHYTKDLTRNVTHLVAGCVGSKKYCMATSFGLPVMTTAWVESMWEYGQYDPFSDGTNRIYDTFRCPVFKGLTICVSQLCREERNSIKSLIEQNGGNYSGALRLNDTTHLVLLLPEGEKYRHAVSWKLKCVKVEWVYDSLNAGYCKDENLYLLDGAEILPKVSTPRKSLTSQPNLDAEISKISCASVSCLDETARLDSGAQQHDLYEEVLASPKTNNQNMSLLLEEKENNFSCNLPQKTKAMMDSISNVMKECLLFNDKVASDQRNNSRDAQQNDPGQSDDYQEEADAQNIDESVVSVRQNPGNDFADVPSEFCEEYLSFKGIKFVLTGFGPKDSEILTDMIVSREGSVYNLNASCEIDVTIVPLFWDEQAAKAKYVVTNCWLQKCIEDEKLLPYDENPLFKPLCVHSSFNQPLHKCVISISQYSRTERDCLRRMVEVLGGTYQEYFVRKASKHTDLLPNTHLIVTAPKGSKFKASKRWNIPAVTKEWLIDAAKTGELPATETYLVEGAAVKTQGSASTVHCGYKHQSVINDAKLLDLYDEPQVEHSAISKGEPKEHDPKVACSNKVKKLIEENKAPGNSHSPNSAAYLNPHVRYHPNFDVGDMLDFLDSPCSSEIHGRSVRKQSIPIDEMFSHNLSVALERCSNPKGDSEHYTQESSYYFSRCARAKPYSTRPLKRVILCVSKKLASLQGELHRTVASLGGDYCWSYDRRCTHFVFLGKSFDVNREFRLAREEGKIVVAPDWVIACKDAMKRVDEALYPHTYSSKMISASEISPLKRHTCGPGESEFSDSITSEGGDHGGKAQKFDVSEQLDELIFAVKAAYSKRQKLLGASTQNPVMSQPCKKVSVPNEQCDENSAACDEKSVSCDENSPDCSEKSPGHNEKSSGCVEEKSIGCVEEKSSSCVENSTGCDENSTVCDENSTGCDEKYTSCVENSTGCDEKSAVPPKVSEISSKENVPCATYTAVSEPPRRLPITWYDLGCSLERDRVVENVTVSCDQDPCPYRLEKTVHLKSDSNSTEPCSKKRSLQRKKTSTVASTKSEHHSSELQKMVIHPDSPTNSKHHSSKSQETEIYLSTSTSNNIHSGESQETVIHSAIETAVASANECNKVPQRRFMFTGFSDYEIEHFTRVIVRCGGEVSLDKSFDQTATHLILAKPVTNEIFLASVASGKWVLHKSYIDAAEHYNKFVEEDDFEWGGIAFETLFWADSVSVLKVACCPYKWRLKIGSGEIKGAFSDWRVLLFAEGDTLSAYTNILRAGGATVIYIAPGSSDAVCLSTITHCFLESAVMHGLHINFKFLMEHNVLCVKLEYLTYYLVEDSPPALDDYIFPEVIECVGSLESICDMYLTP